MQLVCPQCGFAKEIETGQIPAGSVAVSCPACGERFALPTAPVDFVFEPAAATATDPATAVAPETPPVPGETAAVTAVLPLFAGFWQRVVAALLDSVLVTVLQMVAGFLFIVVATGVLGDAASDELLLFAITWVFAACVALGYYVVFTGHGGQTPGKMALRIKVVRTDGSELDYRKAFYREAVGKFVSGLILGIGYLMVAFDERKQGLHDRMAQTYVVKL